MTGEAGGRQVTQQQVIAELRFLSNTASPDGLERRADFFRGGDPMAR